MKRYESMTTHKHYYEYSSSHSKMVSIVNFIHWLKEEIPMASDK